VSKAKRRKGRGKPKGAFGAAAKIRQKQYRHFDSAERVLAGLEPVTEPLSGLPRLKLLVKAAAKIEALISRDENRLLPRREMQARKRFSALRKEIAKLRQAQREEQQKAVAKLDEERPFAQWREALRQRQRYDNVLVAEERQQALRDTRAYWRTAVKRAGQLLLTALERKRPAELAQYLAHLSKLAEAEEYKDVRLATQRLLRAQMWAEQNKHEKCLSHEDAIQRAEAKLEFPEAKLEVPVCVVAVSEGESVIEPLVMRGAKLDLTFPEVMQELQVLGYRNVDEKRLRRFIRDALGITLRSGRGARTDLRHERKRKGGS